jgi:hypothetical protein
LVVAGALARLIPHPPNFTPVGGVSLFAGGRIRGWRAYLIPILLMAVTDPILGAIYGFPAYGRTTVFIYGSFLLNVWIGRRLQGPIGYGRVGAMVLAGSTQFFLLTNFGVWLGALYPHTGAGLLACYVAALPFFGRTLAADLLYTSLLFGLHAWISRRWLARRSRLEGAFAA